MGKITKRAGAPSGQSPQAEQRPPEPSMGQSFLSGATGGWFGDQSDSAASTLNEMAGQASVSGALQALGNIPQMRALKAIAPLLSSLLGGSKAYNDSGGDWGEAAQGALAGGAGHAAGRLGANTAKNAAVSTITGGKSLIGKAAGLLKSGAGSVDDNPAQLNIWGKPPAPKPPPQPSSIPSIGAGLGSGIATQAVTDRPKAPKAHADPIKPQDAAKVQTEAYHSPEARKELMNSQNKLQQDMTPEERIRALEESGWL